MSAPFVRTPFVGRQRELTSLIARLDAARHGEGGVLLVAGEPGIGKTRVVLELARLAGERSWRVLVGRAFESEGLPPYLCFTEALRDYLQHCAPGDLQEAIARSTPEMALLLPNLRDAVPDRPAGPPVGPEQERYRLFESIADLLLALAQNSGLLLVLEDLHWADTPSLLLLLHVARRVAAASVLVVGTHRTVAMTRSHALSDILADLSRERLSERLLLSPFSRDEAGALLEGLTKKRLAPGLVDSLHQETEGNPFFLEEMLRHLQSEGYDLEDPPAAAAGWGIPEGVRQVIGKRLSRLSPETNHLLRAGAVLGDDFTFDLLSGVTGSDELSLVDALNQALEAGMLVEDGESYHFSHALIRQTLYHEMRLPQRQRLHLRAAEVIEQTRVHNLPPFFPVLAAHYRLAGPAVARQGIDYSVEAGNAALAVCAYEDAARHFEAALQLMQAGGAAADPGRQAELLERLGDFLYSTGLDWSRSLVCFEQALALYEGLGQVERAARIHFYLGRGYGGFDATLDIPRALAHLQHAEAVLAHGPETPPLAYLYTVMALAAYRGMNTVEGLTASRRGMEISERLGAEEIWARVAALHGYHLAATGALSAGSALLEQAWARIRRLNDPLLWHVVVLLYGEFHTMLGVPRDAQALYQQWLAEPRLAQAPGPRDTLRLNVGQRCVTAGDLAEARQILAQTDRQEVLLVRRKLVMQLALADGAWDQAERLATPIMERVRRTGSRLDQWYVLQDLACLYRARGEPERGREALEQMLLLAAEGSHLVLELASRTELAVLCAETGRAEAAEQHLRRCWEIMAAGEDWQGLSGNVARTEAVMRAGAGQIEAAAEHFDRALASFRLYALPWAEAETLYLWGRLLSAAGRRSAATERLAAALALYERMGAGERWLERVRAVFPEGSANLGSAIYPDGLTVREVEVLSLIVAGKSNREMAATLVLSERTVERHISNIYEKIGIHGKSARASAVAYALRHKLVQPPPL